ncbi:efflux RND transporter permease subunit [Paludisphaera mucosa]|uniref:Multidrug efflux RND transporter permease subunit n=1 Tax=Paludisphaera mucosa TaxID=3030827 RepID=A0ABT6FGK2_9BACT|nr:multidrug efflux RND transporter permease subunit [Paludisphaera mucosa]
MFSRFFIDRPIFASVLSIIVTLSGGITLWTLPVAQYPDITPPTVEVSAYYPGANAQVVADTVAAPIEQQVNGVENMMYMSSQCTNDGNYTLTVTFKPGVDLNMAQVLVQNRESLAEPILPDLVKRRGVSVTKKSPSILMIINVFSPDGTRDNLYLSNYATIQLRDELARLDGIGDITYLGQRNYSMRVWLDPQKMTFRNLSASDVVRAIEQQNVQVAAGQLGQPPVDTGQAFQFTITTLGRLSESEQFADMILKADQMGGIVRLRDVAEVELGAQGYDQACTLDGRPTVALSVYQRPGSNALETARNVRAKMEELKERFPEGVDYAIAYDTTPFITESVNEVFKTLRDAVVLVAVVVLLFLQNWRSALIPLIAVPVAVVGTFAVMSAMGFSLNNLTLFGLVLAIGIVVDDAIVVVEAVEHHIEHGLAPRDATIKAMEQVSSPVVAVGLVLTAVFVPCAFISGITGQFFRQFALTIATSTLISAFNSLTLSPALAALLLKPRKKGTYEALPSLAFVLVGCWVGAVWMGPMLAGLVPQPEALRASTLLPHDRFVGLLGAIAGGAAGWLLGIPLNRLMGWTFAVFNRGFDAAAGAYTRIVGGLLRISFLVLLLYGGLLFVTYWGFMRTPTGFIPSQDKGYLLVNVQLPDSSSLERTQAVMKQAEALALKLPGVTHTLAIAGQSILMNANAPNFGAMYVMLDDFHHRSQEGLTGPVIAARLQEALQDQVHEGAVNVFDAPPVDGLGTAGGFKIVVEDRGDLGPHELETAARRVVAAGEGSPLLQGLFTSFRADTPWLFLDVDREKAKLLGVSIAELFNTLQVYLGSLYVNDFNRFGRTWQVNVQGQSDFRRQMSDLAGLRVRNEQGAMVPLGSLAQIRDVSGPVMILRYNLYPSAAINLQPGRDVSSGQALDAMQRIVAEEVPQAMRSDWTELALLQRQTGNTAMFAFALAVVLVFLVLAAQYESWALPLAVILVVPMCLLCSTIGVNLWRMDVNIFTQVGFIVLVGLACKNAILIVEFAKMRSESGAPAYEATLEACELRLRPIIMTSMAFILGVVPLILAAGAGAEMRRTLGVAVFSGMLGVTIFGIFLTPVFFYVIQRLGERRRGLADPDAQDRRGAEAVAPDDGHQADLEPDADLVSASR